MNEDDLFLSISARYVAEVRAGLRPRVSDYMRRYPQYADEMVDFVTYYLALEADIPETDSVTLSGEAALIKRQMPGHAHPLATLLMVQGERVSPRQLAVLLDVSADIVLLLEQRRIMPVTIPDEMYKRLAVVLQQPLQTVRNYFIHADFDQELQRIKVAEVPETYRAVRNSSFEIQSFRHALETSEELSLGQMAEWHDILGQERL